MREPTSFNPPVIELSSTRPLGRAKLIRRAVLFQIKLFADGVRDIILSPLSIVAALIGFLFGRDNPQEPFDRLMRFGRQTDHWINLFDAYGEEDSSGRATLDSVADEIETAIRRDYASGGMSAKSADALAALARRLRQRR